jgi:hypothetical protein
LRSKQKHSCLRRRRVARALHFVRAQHNQHKTNTMGVTTRAAAQRKAEATNLLDMPDEVLERILIAASDGGWLNDLRSARLACSRLRAILYSVARAFTANIAWQDEPSPLEMLPRLGGLTRLQLQLDDGQLQLDDPVVDAFYDSDYDEFDFTMERLTDDIVQAVYT